MNKIKLTPEKAIKINLDTKKFKKKLKKIKESNQQLMKDIGIDHSKLHDIFAI